MVYSGNLLAIYTWSLWEQKNCLQLVETATDHTHSRQAACDIVDTKTNSDGPEVTYLPMPAPQLCFSYCKRQKFFCTASDRSRGTVPFCVFSSRPANVPTACHQCCRVIDCRA